MSERSDSKQAAPFAEDTARDTATFLLMDAIAGVPGFVPPRVDGNLSEAILIAAHALIAKLDSMETSQLDALRDLRESLDFLAARSDGDESSEVPTDNEREIMRRALEDEYLARFNQIGSIGMLAAGGLDVDAALYRFKNLTRIKSIEAVDVPTEHEREVIYRALEADYMAHNTPASIEKMDAALCRFKKLAGL